MSEIVVYLGWGSTLTEAEERLHRQVAWNQRWQSDGVPAGQWPADLCNRWYKEHGTFRQEFGPVIEWWGAGVTVEDALLMAQGKKAADDSTPTPSQPGGSA